MLGLAGDPGVQIQELVRGVDRRLKVLHLALGKFQSAEHVLQYRIHSPQSVSLVPQRSDPRELFGRESARFERRIGQVVLVRRVGPTILCRCCRSA